MGGFPYEDDKMHFIFSIRLCVIHCVFDSMHCIAMVTGILLLLGDVGGDDDEDGHDNVEEAEE